MDNDTRIRELSKAYLEKGFALVALDARSKRPVEKAWNTPDKAITTTAQLKRLKGRGVGCALAYSTPRLVSVDSDNLELARAAWRAEGLELDAVLAKGLQITSHRRNRAKAIFALPPREGLLLGVHCNADGYELRCSVADSKRTEQDVLPPTIHPSTGKAYEWIGEFREPPGIPADLLEFWKKQLRPKTRSSDAKAISDAIPLEIINDALQFISNEDYHIWLGIGMSLHSADEAYLEAWVKWSDRDEWDVCECKWRGFKIKAGGRTLASLFHEAKDMGWEPVTFIEKTIPKDPKQAIRMMAALGVDPMDKEILIKKIALAARVNKKAVEAQLKTFTMALAGGQAYIEMTHDDMAKEFIDSIGRSNIVGAYGRTWIYNSDGIYTEKDLEYISTRIPDMFKQQALCKRGGDYRAIAAVVYNRIADEKFFELANAPRGLATKNAFWRLTKNGIEPATLEPSHRQRYCCPVEPEEMELRLWPEFLGQCFGDWRSTVPTGSEDSSIARVQELFGAVMFQLIPMFQTAWLFYGPGDSGKSTLLHVLERLIPPEMTVGVPPTEWYQPYFRAELAGKLLNVAGEISEDKMIGEHFKRIVGGDLTDGRFPYLRVFYFTNTAAHIFMVNQFPWLKDRSTAMMRRWQILGFMNPVKEKVHEFHKELIERELPGIIWWAREGAIRLMKNEHWTRCVLHEKLIGQWARDVNSVLTFKHDEEWIALVEGEEVTSNTALYEHYLDWCGVQRIRNPFGRNRFKAELEGSGLKYTSGQRDQIRGFRGIVKIDVM